MAAAKSSSVPASGLTTVSVVVNMPPGLSGTLSRLLALLLDLVLDSQCLVY